MPSSALVTGAAGFIGSHLAEACAARGYDVVALDALTPAYERAGKLRNLDAVRAAGCRVVEVDLAEGDLAPLVREADVVFHLAAEAGVGASWGERFPAYMRNNVLATQRLLEAAADGSPRSVVIASSSSVYGDADRRPTSEDEPLRPISPYGVTKVTGEQLAAAYRESHGVPAVVVRYFSIFGPRQRPDMAFARLIRAASEGEQFALRGDGEQTRDFTYVGDAVAGTLAAADRGRPGRAYNLGGGAGASLNDAIAILERLTGGRPGLTQRPAAAGDARHTLADVSRARDELGFAPRHSLEAGLAEQVAWQQRTPLGPPVPAA